MHVDLHQKVRDAIDKSLLGQTSAEEQRMQAEHLASCDACRQYLDDSQRVIAGLSGFSFEVDPALQEKVMASLELRAQQLTSQGRRPIWMIYLVAILLTGAGSFAAARGSSLASAAFHLQPGPLQIGVLLLWIVPSLCFCLLFPVVHHLSTAEKGLSQ